MSVKSKGHHTKDKKLYQCEENWIKSFLQLHWLDFVTEKRFTLRQSPLVLWQVLYNAAIVYCKLRISIQQWPFIAQDFVEVIQLQKQLVLQPRGVVVFASNLHCMTLIN